MNISLLANLNSVFKTFFASLATSISYDMILYIALGVELFIIIVFAIKSRYAYEIRMTKSLDKLNRWLFHNKTITKENIKEFTNLIKRTPKRLTYNWQQYILYRDKAPSEYMSVDNLIEKPLRTSSYSANVKNMNIISLVWSLVVFMVAVAYNNANDTIVTATMILSTLIIPAFVFILLVITNIIFTARKSSNLDLLYQNLHLFDRFVDNACADLPKYIDYSLLFSNQEIERGIPELREYYENRARKEKEEFEKAQAEEERIEEFDFSAVGIDGSNILDRALQESEIYLNKKAKILTSIAEREASLENLKKGFDETQKDFQKKMQVLKENIDRLRKQQEETTSRIEGNFLRRQMDTTLAKQENEENEYENQKRKYLAQKAEYEDQIKNFNLEVEHLKEVITEAMESEYETFYQKLFKTSVLNAREEVAQKFEGMMDERDDYEEQLTVAQTKLKRLIDENETLREKLGITETSEILEPEVDESDKKKKPRGKDDALSFKPLNDDDFKLQREEKKEKEPQEDFMLEDETVQEIKSEEPQEQMEPLDEETKEETVEEPSQETEGNENTESETYEPLGEEQEYDMGDDESEEGEESDEEEEESEDEESEEDDDDSTKKRPGRPKGSFKVNKVATEKKSRGRPKKEGKAESKPKGQRGRPKGTTKSKQISVSKTDAPKKGRGRPKKAEGLDIINKKISEEEQKMIEAQKKLDENLEEVVNDLGKKSEQSLEREKILAEIEELKKRARDIQSSDSSAIDEVETINSQLGILLNRIGQLY